MSEDAANDAGEDLITKVEDGVLWITLNRPEAANAITPDQRDRLIVLLAEASELVEVRAVVIGSTGKHFCTGADLRHSRPGPDRPEGAPERIAGDIARMLRDGAQRMVGAILDCEKPVIGAVNGTAAGIGAHLALACDLVVAAESARFIEVFVRRGLVPDGGGAWLLPRLIGLQKAKELMFLGDSLSAADCERWGIANRVVPGAELGAAVDELAGRLAGAPSKALTMTKWLINRSSESSRHSAFEEEAYAQELGVAPPADKSEGLAAFAERRAPRFTGW